MTKLKSLIRSLAKNKPVAIITIVGFSVSISMALVIIAFLIGEYSYDKEYPNINRIYRVFANENVASVREDFREYFLENYPEIEDACRYNNYTATVTYENTPFKGQMIVTDQSFFNIFSSRFLVGNIASSLNNPEDVVITESFARKIFGSENPIGKTLVAEHKELLVVSGVIEDFSDYSSIQGDFITNSKLTIIWEGSTDGEGNRVKYFRMFILVKSAGNISGLEELLTKDISSIKYNIAYPVEKTNLLPFGESYFTQGINRSQTSHANLKLINLLAIISAIIILLAVFNYINLSAATHSGRFQEIGIKKSIGAHRWQIFVQFMTESCIVCFISFMLALLISTFWVSFFEKFLGSQIHLSILLQPVWFAWLVAGIFFISIISGIYPALSVSRLKPITILMKREVVKHRSFGFKASLNILQNVVSVSLIISLIVLSRQIEYIRSKDFGFDTDQLLRVDVHWRLGDKTGIIRDKLLQEPTIKHVSFSHGTPGSIYSTSSWNFGGEEDIVNNLTVDSAFFNVFRIPFIKGRAPLPSDFNKVCYLNETAFKKTGWDSFEGKKYHNMEIIGIVKDFHFANMYNRIAPLIIAISSDMGVSHMTLRTEPWNIPRTINALTETWKEVCPGYELNYQFYNEWLDSMYRSEERLAASIRLFAVLAIIISCLGIMGLAEFSIKKRIKEIGIRKVNGARISEVMVMLNKDFVKWIAVAFVAATPVAWFAMHKWLENFAYKTSLSWWIFGISGILALGIALLTVSWQSWRAATRNPVEALRYE